MSKKLTAHATSESIYEDKTDTAIRNQGGVALPLSSLPAATAHSGVAVPAPACTPPLPDLGLLDPLMRDPEVTEIMVNDTRNVIIERNGRMSFAGVTYSDLDGLLQVTERILELAGATLSVEQPYVDMTLPDGSRVNIVGPPLTPQGPCLTIRKFPTHRMTLEDLVQKGMLDKKMAYFLNACVVGRMNIVISGGTGSGKTTLMNALASLVPRSERIVTIEDTTELLIAHSNSVRLRTQTSTPLSAGISARDLVANALRMRPDRIILGECRRGEAFDMVQAMNTGHEGSMTTLHANSARDALSRLETLCLMSGIELPLPAVRRQISSSLDLIIHVKRFRDSRRRVVSINEVSGMESETITMQDIFHHETSNNRGFVSNGMVPSFVDRLRENGVELPVGFFG